MNKRIFYIFSIIFMIISILLIGCKEFEGYPDPALPVTDTEPLSSIESGTDLEGLKETMEPISEEPLSENEMPDPSSFPAAPASARIVFPAHTASVPGAGEEIFVMNTDGTGITNISNSRENDRHPAWSPDGTQIVFTSKRDSHSQISIMDKDGSEQRRLTYSEEKEFYPR